MEGDADNKQQDEFVKSLFSYMVVSVMEKNKAGEGNQFLCGVAI